MRALLVALLLGGCSSTFESRTIELQLEDDAGSQSEGSGGEAGIEGDAAADARPDLRPPPPPDNCHWADGGIHVGQSCNQEASPHHSGWSCWIPEDAFCGCQVLSGLCLDSL